MASRHQPISVLLLAAAAASGGAFAQAPARVLQGVEDVSPHRKIEDDLYRDLRTPVGWDAVYRVPIKDAQGNVKWMYARRSGAITALFPLSVYHISKEGVEIAVPPGTVFHLGPINPDPGSSPDDAEGGPPPARAPSPPAKAPPMCVMEHEPYRQTRMRQLLTQAASHPVAIEMQAR